MNKYETIKETSKGARIRRRIERDKPYYGRIYEFSCYDRDELQFWVVTTDRKEFARALHECKARIREDGGIPRIVVYAPTNLSKDKIPIEAIDLVTLMR